jgi:hypothetical protein
MNPELCEFEDAVTAALSSGQWDDTLHRHVAFCTQCAELQEVWQSLAGAAALVEGAQPLPAPGLIWWRAQRREQAERAVAAIELMRKLAVAVALVALVVFMWLWKPDVSVIHLSAVIMGVSMLLGSGAVLYGWARGRI